MNKEEKIKELLAEIKALKTENAKYKEQKTYGLVWENEKNKEKIVEDCKKKLPILERVKDKEIITDETKPMNLMIEGDNYHALTCLNYTHQGKIDVIYIDEPYNTGKSKEWKFNDKYVDKEDRFRHSKWLNMMDKRLRLAHNLLSDNGVIFISIDDNEQANLKLLCDEIFGEINFIGNLSVENNPKGRKNSKFISVSNEYCLIYSRNINIARFKNTIPKDASDMVKDENENYIRSGGKRVLVGENFLNLPVKNINADKHYSVYFNEKKNKIVLLKEKNLQDIKQSLISDDYKRYVTYRDNIFIENTYSEKKFLQLFEEEKLDIREGKIYEKHFSGMVQIKSMLTNKKYKAIVNNSKTIYELDLKTTSAKQHLKMLMGKEIFDFPKNVSFIKNLIKLNLGKNNCVLDFFAGSGTTGHAVMELNKEDGGNRKFILCTNNENNNGNGQGGISEAVCYPRIKKVIKGYKKNGDGEWVAGLGGNLHYFKADENSFISVETLKKIDDKKRLELTLKAGELIAIRENIFDEKEHSKYYQIFEDNHKQVAIYFTEELIKLNELMEKLDSKKEKIVYLFGWGKTLFTGDDLGYPDINVKDIPEPIIRIYQEINR